MGELALLDQLTVDPHRVIGLVPFAIAFPTRPIQFTNYFLTLLVQVLEDFTVKRGSNNRDGETCAPKLKQQVNSVSDAKAAKSVYVLNDQDRAVGVPPVNEPVQSGEVAA